MKKIFLVAVLLTSIVVMSCEETPTSEVYRKEVVINGTLFAGQNVDTVWLNWTGYVNQYYDPKALAISDASVIIRGVDVAFYDSLVHDPLNPGRYYSTNPLNKIQPTKTYKITITTPAPDVRVVTAQTTVPDTFSITYTSLKEGDTIQYNLLAPAHEFSWSPSRFQETYLPTIRYLDSGAAMIPKSFYGDTTSTDFRRPDKVDYRIGMPKDQTNTLLPWVFLSYYGNVQFEVYAVDFNYSDFINQIIPAQGGELREIRYQVQGGIGVFGSKSKATGAFKIYLRP